MLAVARFASILRGGGGGLRERKSKYKASVTEQAEANAEAACWTKRPGRKRADQTKERHLVAGTRHAARAACGEGVDARRRGVPGEVRRDTSSTRTPARAPTPAGV